jgi:hypothetical protein
MESIRIADTSPSQWSSRTRVAQALGTIDEVTRAVVPPISDLYGDLDQALRQAQTASP